MDNTVLEIMKDILSIIGTGIVTFLITRYEYNKKVPLDKLEISYNRVYFPIYRLLEEKKTMEQVKKESEKYIRKNIKYVDRTTILAFEYLNETKNKEEQRAFTRYRDNVKKINSKLRKRLGYLESDILARYKYSSPFIRNLYRLSAEIILVYVFFVLVIVMESIFEKITIYFGIGLIFIGMVFCIELIELMIRVAISEIREKRRRKKRK